MTKVRSFKDLPGTNLVEHWVEGETAVSSVFLVRTARGSDCLLSLFVSGLSCSLRPVEDRK